MDNILLLAAVDWCWYNNADGSEAQRPICNIILVCAFTEAAIVSADIRIDWVLNQLPVKPKCWAADRTADCICLYNKQLSPPFIRYDRNGSSSNLAEMVAHKYTNWTKGTALPPASVEENYMGTPKSRLIFLACNKLNLTSLIEVYGWEVTLLLAINWCDPFVSINSTSVDRNWWLSSIGTTVFDTYSLDRKHRK